MAVCKYCSAEVDWKEDAGRWRTYEPGGMTAHQCPQYPKRERENGGTTVMARPRQTYAAPRAQQQTLEQAQLIQLSDAMNNLAEAIKMLTLLLREQAKPGLHGPEVDWRKLPPLENPRG